MASYNELNALIDAYINRNGVQAITGQILNGVLKAMVEQLGRGYTIMGAAIPTTDPGTPDGPECYFASETGTYTDFDGLQVVPGELALLCYTPSGGWTKETIYEGFQAVQATIDGNVGTPSVGVSYANGILSFDFHNMKGNPGDAAGFGTIGADITGGVGTPGVTVESSGPATAKNLQFHFTNLKGETGVTSVVATVDNTTGTPSCVVSLQGQQLTLAFSGLKGAQGDTGSSVDYPFTIVNNLTTDDATQALSAAQGVVLQGEITQLEHKVDDLPTEFLVRGIGFVENVLIQSSGNESSNNAFNATTYIPVNEMEKLYFFNTIRSVDSGAYMAFYDENQVFISAIALSNETQNAIVSVDVPEGTNYVRISIRKDSSQNFRAYTIPIVVDTFINKDLEVLVGERVNLISSWTPNAIITRDGSTSEITNSSVTNYIPVKEGVKYFGSIFGSRYAFYDKYLRFITGYYQDGSIAPVEGFSIPTGRGIKYARFTYQSADTTNAWLSEYSYFPPLPHKEYYKSKTQKNFVRPGTIGITDLSFISHDPDTDMIKSYGKNGYIKANGDVKTTNQSWSYTDFIELEEGGRYYIINNYPTYTAFYDENRQFVSNGVQAGWFVVPTGVKYIRASWNSLDKICFLSKYSGELRPFAYKPIFKEEIPTEYNGEDISVFNKIICIGDSLTAGVFNVGVGSPTAQPQWSKYNYPVLLKKITGVETVNTGIGSITTPGWYEYYQNEDLSGFDCAIIQLGVNDGGWSNDVKDGYDNIIAKLRNENKDIVIFISTIIRSNSYGNSETAKTYNENLASYVADRAETNTILLDMNRYGHLKEGLAYNAGHLTAYGYWRLAADYKAYIGWYMHNNRDDFRFVQFIGTNCYY